MLTHSSKHYMPMIFACCAIMMVTMGIRQISGLFVQPLVLNTGLSVGVVSLAMAIGQFLWGSAQPVGGILAERWGTRRVVGLGMLSVALSMLSMPWVKDAWGVFSVFAVFSAIGAGFASFSLLMGAAAQAVPEHKRGFASGVINAGSSIGQFVFAPLTQWMMERWNWMTAGFGLGLIALSSLPLVGWIASSVVHSADVRNMPVEKVQFSRAWCSSNYKLLHLGFFTCGFHIAFLVTHLPGEVSICGLPARVAGVALAIIGLFNIVGSVGVGILCSKFPMSRVLGHLYLIRALAVIVYVFAPKTAWTWYVFAGVLGTTWLATVPPTAGLVGGLFGPRNLATLFGMTMLSHQVGAFLGAFLGGVAIEHLHNYSWMWWADATLALIAALASYAVKIPSKKNNYLLD